MHIYIKYISYLYHTYIMPIYIIYIISYHSKETLIPSSCNDIRSRVRSSRSLLKLDLLYGDGKTA